VLYSLDKNIMIKKVKDYCVVCGVKMSVDLDRYIARGNYCAMCNNNANIRSMYDKDKEGRKQFKKRLKDFLLNDTGY